MTDLIEVKTADLAGEALGWAIGKAEGLDLQLAPPGYNGVHDQATWDHLNNALVRIKAELEFRAAQVKAHKQRNR